MDKELFPFHHTSHLLGLLTIPKIMKWQIQILPYSPYFRKSFHHWMYKQLIPFHYTSHPPFFIQVQNVIKHLNGKTNLSNPLLFPAFKSETDDSTSSESNVTFCTITSREMVVQGTCNRYSNKWCHKHRCPTICNKHKQPRQLIPPPLHLLQMGIVIKETFVSSSNSYRCCSSSWWFKSRKSFESSKQQAQAAQSTNILS